MTGTTVRMETPASSEEAAGALASASADGLGVRFQGGGTKLSWGRPVSDCDLVISTGELDRIVEHNVGDLTAVLDAGVPLASAQEAFAEEGQMLALDPPEVDGATIGGVVATGESGPLRHRFGAIRDLVIGIRAALPDGTVVQSGGKVIKNVAGYDLGKLFSGSFGALGMIVEVSLRLHPKPLQTATAVLRAGDPGALARAAMALSHSQLEQLALDVAWEDGAGAVMARFGGARARVQAEAALAATRELAGLSPEIEEADERLWSEQRARQRSREGMVVRVSGLQTRLEDIVRSGARQGASVAGRGGSGLCWLRFEGVDAEGAVAQVEELRRELRPLPCVVLDAPDEVREALDPWGPMDPALLALMERVKQRFDPQRTCNPGIYGGSI
jgi:glycolate oxidase FAD binding subunit